jgi:DNA-binding IclR family transcriptional regulator
VTVSAKPSAPRPASPSARPEYRVEALAKGLRILSLFTEQRPTWRVSGIAPAVGMPLPTVYRVVRTLTAEGYLNHLPNGDYRPAVRVLTLGGAALRSLDLGSAATPRLQRLAEETGETVNLAALTGDRVLHLVRLRDSDLVTANIQVGSTLLRSVAAPVHGPGGTVVAGASLAVQSRDWSSQRIVRELRPVVADAGRDISALLGYAG